MLNERNIGSLEDLRESLFLERYQRLLSWAMRLTNRDRWVAEDLVQEAFIQFIRGRTSVDAIANVDGYLWRMLQYLNLARVARQTEQMQRQALSIADYDSLSMGLHAFDIDRQLQVKEQLIDICRYACIRKETSRSGSVLILRFFHEYSPSEIGKLLCRPRHTVDEWQRVARAEMKSYLDNPRQLSFVRSKSGPKVTIPDTFIARTDLSSALRQMIFNSRLGECLTVDKLKDIYVSEILENLTPDKLGHIVSCRKCLDDANQLLGLPSLSERFDVDENDHFEPPSTGNGSGRSRSNLRRRLKKHLREVVEHKPQQLRVRVDGVLISSYSVDSGGGEFQLNLNPTRKLSFIDVSSEQGVPLLLFEAGPQNESWGQIDLNEGRLLEASLCENTLSITYHAAELDQVRRPDSLRLLVSETDETPVLIEDTLWERLKTALKAQLLLTAWLNPARVTILVATILLLATSFRPHISSALTPVSVLQRALVAEQQRNSIPGHITRRVITFEERQQQGTVVSRRRIEMWEDATNGARADRIFDDHNHLLAERLQNKNGGAAVFHHSKTVSMKISAEDIFQLQPTARTFEALVGANPILVMEQRPGLYVITYSGKSDTAIGKLLKATLTLSAFDLHPIEQSLVIERDGQVREYRFIEVRFEQVAHQEVDSAVFQPSADANPSIAGSSVTVDRYSLASLVRTTPASAELEIEVAYLLDKAKADRNEQITLSRDKNGLIRIEGVVETSTRKNELLQAFRPVIDNPSVSINIQTEEAVSDKDVAKNLEWSTIQLSNSNADRIAVDRELREYLSKHKSGSSYGNDPDRDVNAFASQTVNRSYRAVFHAVELKQLADRFSNTNIRSISAMARDKWHEMIRTHAEGLRREYAILRKELEPIFHAQGSAECEQESITSDEQLIAAIQKLYRLARANDETIRAGFTVSQQGPRVPLNSEQFWKDLIDAQQTAASIERF